MILHAITSIQFSRLKRDLNFSLLFYIRLISALIPFVITVPLALITKSYWSIVVGTISINLSNVIALLFLLKWRPRFKYSFVVLSNILSFSIWSFIESLMVWVINWGDTFVVSQVLNQYYLGLYKTSMNSVNQFFGLISASMVPVLLSSLSRVQNNIEAFESKFLNVCFYSSLFLFPMGAFLFVYKSLFCRILLGPAWDSAAVMIGIWGLINSFAIIFNSYNSCILIAKGKPKVSVIIQLIQIIMIIPVVYYSAKKGFEVLSYSRSLVRIVGMVSYTFVVWAMFKINIFKLFRLILPSLIGTFVIIFLGLYLTNLQFGFAFYISTIIICCLVYLAIILVFPTSQKAIFYLVHKAFSDLLHKKLLVSFVFLQFLLYYNC